MDIMIRRIANPFLLLIVIFFLSLTVIADTCPFGIYDDPYPGQCNKYIDKDNDGICDLSLIDTSKTIVVEKEVEEVEEVKEEIEIVEVEKIETEIEKEAPIDTVPIIPQSEIKEVGRKDKYLLKIILPIWFILFILTIMSKHKKGFKLKNINQMWNWITLFSFAPVAFTGIIMILREIGIMKGYVKLSALFIHNIFGIIFVLASISHIYLKWTYYRSCLKKKKCDN